LQFSLLNPALALLLVALLDATPAEIGWVLAVYNTGGFLASLVIPAYADRRREYLRPLLVCALLTVALAGVLALATTLPVAVIALVVLGGPAGVGVTLLFAHLKHSGADTAAVVNVRAVVSFAWVAGPPLATLIIGRLGTRAVLAALALVALANVATTATMLGHRRRQQPDPAPADDTLDTGPTMSRPGVVTVTAVFIVLQATNSTVVSIMGLFVTGTLRIDVMWSGAALGVAAALEIPALLAIGRLTRRFSHLALLASGGLAGVAYYVVLAATSGPVVLLAAQSLNAWFFATVAGTGLSLFQRIIPRPGLATGLFTNTRRLGAIASGPLIGLAALTPLGYRGVFLACAALTVVALITIRLLGRPAPRPTTARPVIASASQSKSPS
jgi:SET family sugar efflux transporter-like MFS transporter